MENFENENLEPTLEQEPPKLSAKEYVRQRLTGLADGNIEPPKRRVGRPRLHPDGYKYDRKDPNVDPEISAKRAAAGRKGIAVVQGRKALEVERRKYGRIFQEEFTKELDQVKTEIINSVNAKQYDHQFGKQRAKSDMDEMVWNCRILIEGLAWGRSYFPPPPYESYIDEFDALVADFEESNGNKKNVSIHPSKWRSYSAWPEICCQDVVNIAQYQVDLAQFPLLKDLAARSLEAFLEFAAKQKDDQIVKALESAVSKATRALPKIKNDTIFTGTVPLPDSEPPRPIKEVLAAARAERSKWEFQGRDTISVTQVDSPQERQLREQTELEAQVILRKQEEHARAIELQQRQLLGEETYNSIQQALHGNIFGGAIPRRQ